MIEIAINVGLGVAGALIIVWLDMRLNNLQRQLCDIEKRVQLLQALQDK